MVSKEKIEQIKRKIRENIKKDDMYIQDEPDYSGDPKNTISRDNEDEGGDKGEEKRNSDKE